MDKSKFKTCSQTSICPRLREKSAINSIVAKGFDSLGNLLVSNGSKDFLLMFRLINEKLLNVKIHRDDLAQLVMDDYLPKAEEALLQLVQPMRHQEMLYIATDNLAVKLQTQPLSITIIQDGYIKVQLDSIFLNEALKNDTEDIEDEEIGEEEVKQAETNFVHASFHLNNQGVLYGLPEHTGSFALEETTQGEPYRLYNLDVFEYELNSTMALYGSIPYIISNDSKYGSVGIFWNNPSETWVDLSTNKDFSIISEDGNMDVFVMLGQNLSEIQQQYRDLTGPPLLPPLFALGYHQCRWNYNDENEVLDVNNRFDAEDIPYDVIWLDIEHTHEKRYMTWHPNNFKTPKKLLQKLKQHGRQLVTIIDPHIKNDEAYDIYKTLAKKDLLVKDSHGGIFEGHCWPGKSVWVDFVCADARLEWSKMIQKYASQYQVHIWNDMNEPSVFDSSEITFPKNAQHTFKDGKSVSHHLLHNLYGALMHQSTFEGLSKAKRNKRAFVLSRSFYAGSQRYGAVWTGDNKADWDHFKASVPMLLSLGICGLPFVGADVGGFFGDPEPELLTRWYQTGAFYPFFRGHAHIETKRREPWVFGEPYTSIIRAAIKLRYSLLPYIYTLFHESNVTGKPVMRSLAQEFNSEKFLREERAFMLGSALIHQPIYQAKGEIELVIPEEDIWYDYYSGELVKDKKKRNVELSDVVLLIRGGSILPIKENVKKNSVELQKEPYTIVISPNQQGFAKGSLYIDDGESVKPKFSLFYLSYKSGKLEIQASIRNFSKNCRISKVVLFGNDKPISKNVDYDFGKSNVSIKLGAD